MSARLTVQETADFLRTLDEAMRIRSFRASIPFPFPAPGFMINTVFICFTLLLPIVSVLPAKSNIKLHNNLTPPL